MDYVFLLRNPLINSFIQKFVKHTSVTNLPIIQFVMNHFCTNETQLPSTIKSMKKNQYSIILDYAMEHNKSESQKTRDTILKNMDLLSSKDLIALKPSSLIEKDLETILDKCKERYQRVMIDAEEYEFQQKIHPYIRELQIKYNTKMFPCIYNTYQCYLKTTADQIASDIDYFERMHSSMAIKLVRGAYLDYEIENARRKRLPIPVFESIHQTNVCYNRSMLRAIQLAKKEQIHLNIATHNPYSIQIAKQNIKAYDKNISFSQLKGMRDDLSQKLLLEGYTVYKYLPYGDYNQMVPYLLRRLQESKMSIKTV